MPHLSANTAKVLQLAHYGLVRILTDPDRCAGFERLVNALADVAGTMVKAVRPAIEALDKHMRSPEGQVAVGKIVDASERIAELLRPKVMAAAERWREIKSTPPEPGYETLFLGLGENRFEAWFWSIFYRRKSEEFAYEYNIVRRRVIKDIRKLARGGARPKTIAAHADRLCERDALAWIEELLDSAGRAEMTSRFVELVKSAAAHDREACQKLPKLTRELFPDIPSTRGKKAAAASIVHQRILRRLAQRGKPTAYTWDDESERFTDSASEATRVEFGLIEFDPRSAVRRLRRRTVQ